MLTSHLTGVSHLLMLLRRRLRVQAGCSVVEHLAVTGTHELMIC